MFVVGEVENNWPLYINYDSYDLVVNIYSNKFDFGQLFGIYMYEIITSVNRESFVLFFINYIHFSSFSYLTAVASTLAMLLNSRGETGNSCLVPSLSRKELSVSPLSMLLSTGLLSMFLVKLRKFHCIPSLLWVCIMNSKISFVKIPTNLLIFHFSVFLSYAYLSILFLYSWFLKWHN